jgi:hypothetical protein
MAAAHLATSSGAIALPIVSALVGVGFIRAGLVGILAVDHRGACAIGLVSERLIAGVAIRTSLVAADAVHAVATGTTAVARAF